MVLATKKITNKSCRKSTHVKNKDGKVTKSEAEQTERWRENFSEVQTILLMFRKMNCST